MTARRVALAAAFVAWFLSVPPASAADIHLFGRLGSSQGLGLDGPSVGVESRFAIADFIFCTGVVRAQKDGVEASFTSGSLEWRRAARRVLYGARLTVVDQRTPDYSKTAFFPSLRVGYAPRAGYALLATYSAPDNTENEVSGFGLSFEALRHHKLGVVVDAERVSFQQPAAGPAAGGSRSGTRFAVLIGARF